jgi:hypothetical protein
VWDWERMRHRVPVGFDVLHYRFQTSSLTNGQLVPAAASRTLSEARSELAAVGVEAASHDVLLRLYFLEIALRLAAGREMGMPIHDDMLRGLMAYLGADE